jgi:hypothetical protein
MPISRIASRTSRRPPPRPSGSPPRQAAVGGSIEDYSGDRNDPIYGFDLAVARVRAAVKVAHSLPVPFLLTAR